MNNQILQLQNSFQLKENINKEDNILKIIKYYSPICNPCKTLDHIIKSVINEYSQIQFYSICIYDCENFNNIKKVPILEFYLNSKLIHTEIGLLSKEQLKEAIHMSLNLTSFTL